MQREPRSLKSRALQLLAQRDQSRLELRRTRSPATVTLDVTLDETLESSVERAQGVPDQGIVGLRKAGEDDAIQAVFAEVLGVEKADPSVDRLWVTDR